MRMKSPTLKIALWRGSGETSEIPTTRLQRKCWDTGREKSNHGFHQIAGDRLKNEERLSRLWKRLNPTEEEGAVSSKR